MAVPLIFNTIEQTALSTWLRESTSVFGFYFILLFHTIGMSLVVGASAVVDLRILGVAPGLPLKPLKRLFTIMWVGLALNVTTGLFLLTAYPTKALTNPDFYIKMTFIGLAVFTMRKLSIQVFGDTRSEAFPALPHWRRNARRPSCLDLVTLLRQEVASASGSSLPDRIDYKNLVLAASA